MGELSDHQLKRTAMSALSIMFEHSGPLSARLAWALERAHVYVEPFEPQSLPEQAAAGRSQPNIANWFTQLGAARAGSPWSTFASSLELSAQQTLAGQLLDVLLGLISGQDVETDPPRAAEKPALPSSTRGPSPTGRSRCSTSPTGGAATQASAPDLRPTRCRPPNYLEHAS
jgi:hypothetical protein